MKDKIAEEFYNLVEFLKTKNTEDVLTEFYERELGDILDYVESWCDEEHFWESYEFAIDFCTKYSTTSSE